MCRGSLAWGFCWNLNNVSRCVYDSFACSWKLYPPIGYLVQSSYEVIHLVLLHVSMLSLIDVTKRPAFSEGKWRSSRWGKGGGLLKGKEERKAEVRMR